MKNKSIITQTVIRVSIVFIVALAIFGTIFVTVVTRNKQRDIIIEKIGQTENYAVNIDTDIDSLTTPMVSLGTYDSATALMRKSVGLYSGNWMTAIRNLDDYLMNISLFKEDVVDIMLLSPVGDVVYCMNDSMQVDYDYVNTDWFAAALEQEGLIKYAFHENADYYYVGGRTNTITCIYPVYKKKQFIGYVLLEYDMSSFVSQMCQDSTENTGFALVDTQGNCMLYTVQKSEIEHDWSNILFMIQETIDLGLGDRGLRYHGYHYGAMQMNTTGWYMISETNVGQMFAPVLRMMLLLALVIIAGLLVLMWISRYMSKSIHKSMDELIQRIESFDGTKVPEKYETTDVPLEIEIIGSKFDEMAEHTSRLIQDVYLAQIAKQQLELETLVNQINPHFLYNVFQLIQTEAVLSDNEPIEEMIIALSSMMRYTMDRTSEYVTIRREVDYIRDYLMFYKKRFPNLFEVEITCDEEIMDCSILKFILQPVVENCFKHAFKNRKSGGLIRIQVQPVGSDIVFTVWDNGSGIKPERMQEIRTGLSGRIDGSGIGIINTNARLRLVYGDAYGISFESEPDVYTKAMIRIPLA